jgi:flagellum-specific peptidoglycan hydrolase FlgJ
MRLLLLNILFFSALFSLRAQSAAEAYVNKFNYLAIEILNIYQIPASLILGIALQESAAGTSKLCRVNHNHFGVKGRVKSSKTKSGYVTSYRKFESDEASYLYIGELISSRKYYTVLKGNMDYMKWLKAIHAAKYATSPTWVSHVDKMIKRYNLTRFDKPFPAPLIPYPAKTIINTRIHE